MMTTLSAYNQECINTVLSKKPDYTPDLVKAISDFEAIHGNATKAEKVVAGSRRAFSPPRQQGGTFRKWGGPMLILMNWLVLITILMLGQV